MPIIVFFRIMDDDGPYSSQQAVQSGPNLNISYVKSLQGILKVVELVSIYVVRLITNFGLEIISLCD